MKPSRCIFTPPYTGPAPHGLTEASDIQFWSNFIRSDNAIPNPVGYDEFLFYSGDDGLGENVISIREYISQYYSRTVASWARVFYLSKPARRGSHDPLASVRWLFDSYLANGKHGDTHALNLHIKCLSWSLARRAAIHGGTVHLALWKGAPLLVKDSFWGEYEAGIITGSDSKVERIVRYDVERLPNHSGEQNSPAIAIDPGVVVWERTKHKMLGIPFDNWDWVHGPSGDYGTWEVTWRAEAGRLSPFQVYSSVLGGWESPRSSGWRWKGSIAL